MSKASARPQSVPASSARKLSTPSPEMLRAVFAIMREMGLLSQKERLWGPTYHSRSIAAAGKKPAAPTQSQLDAVFALTRELGWKMLNDQEVRLIETLRSTTYKGRNHVYETAEAMRRYRPWIDDSVYNTEE